MGYKTNSLGNLRLTAVKTANYNAVPGDLVACDVSAGSFTVTLPTAPADQTAIGVVLVTQSTAPGATAAANVLTVACGGSDVFTKTGGSATAAVPLTNQQETYIYNVSGAIWSNGLGRFARASAPPTKTVAPTTTYTALAGDIVLATAGAGGFTVTLPAVSKNAQVQVKKVDSGAGTITVSPASGTIDGAASYALVVQYDSVTLVCDGTNWNIKNPFVGNARQETIIRANSLNQLATATGNYAMGGNTLTGLALAAADGQPAAFQQLAGVTTFTSSGTFTPDSTITSGLYLIICVGGGGGGGGGGTALTTATAQLGGAGGGQGESKATLQTLAGGTGYTVTVGAAGTGGAGGASGAAHAGIIGVNGGNTTFAGTTNIIASGGGGGNPSTGTDTSDLTGGVYGAAATVGAAFASNNIWAGCGGGTLNVFHIGLNGGAAVGYGAGGGGAGGSSGTGATGSGGNAGVAGSFANASGGAGGSQGASSGSSPGGVTATNAAATDYGAGGGGGGGACGNASAGGSGGNGGKGICIVIGPLI